MLVSAVHSPSCAGTRNLTNREGSCAPLLPVEAVYFVQTGKRGLLFGLGKASGGGRSHMVF